MTSNTEHQLKLKALQERLDNISNDFKRELITGKKYNIKQKNSLYKNQIITPLRQEQLTASMPQQSEPTTQMWQQASSKEQPILQEDLKFEERFRSLSDEKIFQKTMPDYKSWKYIPKEKLIQLKKKTLGHIYKKKQGYL